MALLTSILTGGVNLHPTTSEEANFIGTDFFTAGVVGTISNTNSVAPMTGAYAVNAQGTPDMTVAVTAGAAYVTATPSSQNSQRLRVRLTANENVTISANSSGSTKYDWIYLKVDPTLANAPTLSGDTTSTLVTSRSSSLTADDGTPPTYGLVLAVVTVANGASTITNSVIRDARIASSLNIVSATDGWQTGLLPAVSSVTANGNRSYTITFASTVASILSSGMRLRTTRTVAAPTQCTSLNGTTQYYSKTTPNKLTFTDDFVVSAWVKLSSYANGIIASRYNGTSGWYLYVTAAGLVQLTGHNAGSGNASYVASYQSLPLNKWVHVTAQLDMSTFTATTTTSYIMFDGVNIPAQVTRIGTNPTALVQAGNLEIGSYNGGTLPFNGKIAQVAIYNAKVTQANINLTYSQGLTGSEASLASAYSFNNAITDLNTTTPNDLTAQGSAVATNADSPFGNAGTSTTLDYALVQAISTTVATVQVPEGCTITTSGGVTSVAYSVQGNPYGWVSDKGRWELLTVMKALAQIAGPVASTWYNPSSVQLSIPVGTWIYGYTGKFDVDRAAASPINIFSTLSTSNSSETNTLMTACSSNGSLASLTNNVTIGNSTSLSAATPHYLNILTSAASITNIYITGSQAATKITALPSGL